MTALNFHECHHITTNTSDLRITSFNKLLFGTLRIEIGGRTTANHMELNFSEGRTVSMFYPDVGSGRFLRNVCTYLLIYKAPHPAKSAVGTSPSISYCITVSRALIFTIQMEDACLVNVTAMYVHS
jgi:hypothetical protein